MLNDILVIVIGVVLRIVVPILITAMLVYWLKGLDKQWQAEAQEQLPVLLPAQKPPCWEQKGCTIEEMSKCAATEKMQPCWQVFRQEDGQLMDVCLTCDVFKTAPVPNH